MTVPYTLYHGDCLDYFEQIAPASIDAVICDIPSGRTACAWDSVIPFDAMWAGIKRVVKKHAAIVLLGCTQPFTSALVMSNPKMFKYDWVWEKSGGTGYLQSKRRPLVCHESICVFGRSAGTYIPQMWNGKPNHSAKAIGQRGSNIHGEKVLRLGANVTGLRYPRSVMRFDKHSSQSKLHPTQKPLALLEYLVKTYTNEGDLILDFTMGSGTTGAACGNLNRRFIGIEKDKTYYDLGAERIATAYEPLRHMQVVV